MPGTTLVKPKQFKNITANLRVVKESDAQTIDVVATVTCDSVDSSREVVLPGGVDLTRYVKSPRIMLCHAYGDTPGQYYPLPIGKAVWTKRQNNALMQGIQFAKTPMGLEIAELFRDEMLNTFSIGFISLEASPPTKQEIAARPDWKNAELIHRRWELLEVSVVPIPCNENAIGEWVRKGHRIPSFWTPKGIPMAKKKGDPVPEPEDKPTDEPNDDSPERSPHNFEPGDHVAVHKDMGGGCGMVKSMHDKDMPEGAEDHTDGERPAAMVEMHDAEHKGMGLFKCFGMKCMTKMMDEKALSVGDRIIVHSLAGGGFGVIKSIHKGTVPHVDEDHTDGSEDPAAVIELVGADGKATGKTIGALAKHLAAVQDKAFYGYPWEGEEAEKGNAYRTMAYGLLDRHKKIQRTRKAGHLYANAEKMEAHYVRHESDDNESKGYHSAEQCKAMLAEAPNCKGVTVSMAHPDDEDGWEMLHPAPHAYDQYFARSIKAMNESSGTAGGYTLAPEAHVDHTGKDDFLEEDVPSYMPKPREVVQWEDHEGMHAGAGRVKSIHAAGKAVPDVMNDCIGTKEMPHARINLFKKGEDGDYTETDHHVGVRCMMCKRMPILMVGKKTEPTQKTVPTDPPAPAAEPTLKRIPIIQTPEQYEAELVRTLKERENSPDFQRKAIDEAIIEYIGCV